MAAHGDIPLFERAGLSRGVSRRTLLSTTARLAVVAVAGRVGLRSTSATESAPASLDAFMAVSRRLTGMDNLDAALGARLHEALGAEIARFQADVQALRAIIDERSIEPLQLQHTLDAEQAALAPLPRKIVTAWYTGIVGEGERARASRSRRV